MARRYAVSVVELVELWGAHMEECFIRVRAVMQQVGVVSVME